MAGALDGGGLRGGGGGGSMSHVDLKQLQCRRSQDIGRRNFKVRAR